ncbi:MAG: hypothetical protein ACT4OJ_08710 [Bacteroidota bacterium]
MKQLFIICSFVIAACNQNESRKTVELTADTTLATVASPVPVKEEINWDYSEEKDEMTEKVRYFASCISTNTAYFDFPYDGGSNLNLLIRKMNGRNEVILRISKGQFGSSYSSTVKIKFDEEQPKIYGFNEAADGSSDYIFLNGGPSIILKLKNSKKVKIQPPFYQEGQVVFEFNTDGLKWEY